jgi:glycosyltransferase involved in cell wall biosynthesis
MTRDRLTVAFCCNTAFAIANFRGGVIRALVRQGHRVVVVAPEDSYVATLRDLGAEFVPWKVTGRGCDPLAEGRALRDLVRIYRALRPDLAFHFTIKSVIYGAVAGRLSNVPVISVITGLGYVFLNENGVSAITRTLYRLTLGWSREVWFLNDDDRETFQRIGLLRGAPVRVLPGEGIDVRHFAPAPLPCAEAGGKTFLMVGRLLRDKGVMEFVEAARLVRRDLPGTRFQLLGAADADNPSAISGRQVDAWVAEGWVEYLGVALDVRPVIAGADCVVLPSYREGVPRTLLEAASMGRPLVATDVPGCRDVVLPGESGLLCRARDAQDLAKQMRTIASMGPSALEAFGRRGRQLVTERFDEEVVREIYFEAISSLA